MSGNAGQAGLPRRVGRYQLHAQLAAGGMATVFAGQLLGPVGFSRVVAVKRMHSFLAKDPKFLAMFVDEAWLSARIQHPNVVATIDVVEEGAEIFLVMDYVRGESVAGLQKAVRVPMPPAIASSIASQALSGLHAAHEARDETGRPLGMVHRDVSPHNILVGVDGLARVADFGIAKAASRLHVTKDQELRGKLAYMPPEQLMSDPALDRRADVYATGVVLWEMLAGEKLNKGSDFADLLQAASRAELPTIASRRGDVPASIDDVLRRATAKEMGDRFASAEEFQLALETAIAPASSRQVGDWVVATASETLKRRKAVIDLIEQSGAHRAEAAGELERLVRVDDHHPAAESEQTVRDSPPSTKTSPGPQQLTPAAQPPVEAVTQSIARNKSPAPDTPTHGAGPAAQRFPEMSAGAQLVPTAEGTVRMNPPPAPRTMLSEQRWPGTVKMPLPQVSDLTRPEELQPTVIAHPLKEVFDTQQQPRRRNFWLVAVVLVGVVLIVVAILLSRP